MSTSKIFILVHSSNWIKLRKRLKKNKAKDIHELQEIGDYGRYLIHIACLNGIPKKCMEALLTAYPDAAKQIDDEGSTPLHYYIHYVDKCKLEVLDVLLNAYPQALNVQDNYGCTPMYHAMEHRIGVKIDALALLLRSQYAVQALTVPCHPLEQQRERRRRNDSVFTRPTLQRRERRNNGQGRQGSQGNQGSDSDNHKTGNGTNYEDEYYRTPLYMSWDLALNRFSSSRWYMNIDRNSPGNNNTGTGIGTNASTRNIRGLFRRSTGNSDNTRKERKITGQRIEKATLLLAAAYLNQTVDQDKWNNSRKIFGNVKVTLSTRRRRKGEHQHHTFNTADFNADTNITPVLMNTIDKYENISTPDLVGKNELRSLEKILSWSMDDIEHIKEDVSLPPSPEMTCPRAKFASIRKNGNGYESMVMGQDPLVPHELIEMVRKKFSFSFRKKRRQQQEIPSIEVTQSLDSVARRSPSHKQKKKKKNLLKKKKKKSFQNWDIIFSSKKQLQQQQQQQLDSQDYMNVQSNHKKFRFMHAVLTLHSYLPESVYDYARQYYPDQLFEKEEGSGNYPLHIVASMCRANNHSDGIDREVLLLDISTLNDKPACMKNTSGQLPLHIALCNDDPWSFTSIDILMKAYMGASAIMDEKSGLYPFELAAVQQPSVNNNDDDDNYDQLSKIFMLLQEHPDTLRDVICNHSHGS
mmetsp:Transcript_18030/g.20855  ORF Transcript_18030/g.20855 Transcript_18030/m.20855 type:complete len:694 (+) Transcript_18030:100-2181(+)